MAEPQVTFSPDIRQVESQESDDVMKLLTQQSFVREDNLEPAGVQNHALKCSINLKFMVKRVCEYFCHLRTCFFFFLF